MSNRWRRVWYATVIMAFIGGTTSLLGAADNISLPQDVSIAEIPSVPSRAETMTKVQPKQCAEVQPMLVALGFMASRNFGHPIGSKK